MQNVAIDIITGFLGSGKTSLIKHVLQHGLQGRRVAVVVNDIGEMNVDGRILEGINVDRMVELSNGCICCSISYQFGVAMQEIIATTKPELILIEATGAADPVPLSQEVRRVGLRVDGLITVVDGLHIRQLYKDAVVARQQIQAADFLILNKCDLLTQRQRQQVSKFLQRHNPRALLLPSEFGQVGTDVLLATSAQRLRQEIKDHPAGTTHHLHDDAIEAFTYTSQYPLHRQRFTYLLQHLPPDLYRAKGILHFDQDTWSSLFNYTCGRYDIDWFRRREDFETPSQAVFIGRHILRQRDDLLAQLTVCELS